MCHGELDILVGPGNTRILHNHIHSRKVLRAVLSEHPGDVLVALEFFYRGCQLFLGLDVSNDNFPGTLKGQIGYGPDSAHVESETKNGDSFVRKECFHTRILSQEGRSVTHLKSLIQGLYYQGRKLFFFRRRTWPKRLDDKASPSSATEPFTITWLMPTGY